MCRFKEMRSAITDYIVEIQMESAQYVDIDGYADVAENYSVYALLSSEVCLGGVGGFNDQGGEGVHYKNDILDEDEIEMFNSIMNSILPDSPFHVLKKIRERIKSEQRTDCSDYYGNTYDYQLNYIPINDLLDVLENENLIEIAYKNI